MGDDRRWPVAAPLQIQGSGDAWPLSRDPTENYPRKIITISAVGSFPIARGAWIEVIAAPEGWTFQPEGAQGPSVALKASACFPVPKDGVFIIDAAGTGSVQVVIWPAHLGPIIGQGRGYNPPGSETPAAGSTGDEAAHNAATLANTKEGETFIGTAPRTLVTIYGELAAADTVWVLYSNDGADWYYGPAIVVGADPLGTFTFSMDFASAAPYVAFATGLAQANAEVYFSWR